METAQPRLDPKAEVKMNDNVTYPALSLAELSGKMKAGGLTLIDANGTESYAEGHIPGALDFESMSTRLPQGLVISGPADRAIIPSCKLSPKAQAARIGKLRSGLLSAIGSTVVEPGGLRLLFADTPENVDGLTEFIRFERECCTSLRFGLEWADEGGPVILEMKGPAPLLAALYEMAEQAHGR